MKDAALVKREWLASGGRCRICNKSVCPVHGQSRVLIDPAGVRAVLVCAACFVDVDTTLPRVLAMMSRGVA